MYLKQVLRETESLCLSLLHLPVQAQPGTLPSLSGCCGWHLPTFTCDLPPGTAAILTFSFAEQRLLELMCFLHGSDKPQETLPSCLLLTAGLCRASEARKQSSLEAQCSLAGIPRDSRQAENSHRAQLPSHLMVAWGRREQPCAKPGESDGKTNTLLRLLTSPASGPHRISLLLLFQVLQKHQPQEVQLAPPDGPLRGQCRAVLRPHLAGLMSKLFPCSW